MDSAAIGPASLVIPMYVPHFVSLVCLKFYMLFSSVVGVGRELEDHFFLCLY